MQNGYQHKTGCDQEDQGHQIALATIHGCLLSRAAAPAVVRSVMSVPASSPPLGPQASDTDPAVHIVASIRDFQRPSRQRNLRDNRALPHPAASSSVGNLGDPVRPGYCPVIPGLHSFFAAKRAWTRYGTEEVAPRRRKS